mmetsp:Transcript_16061/g.40850  ORF Transcript_16061/g.40850 Transcript_16061/m.40850 type:complete len:221 (+) Transcript_16061:229-891(+)
MASLSGLVASPMKFFSDAATKFTSFISPSQEGKKKKGRGRPPKSKGGVSKPRKKPPPHGIKKPKRPTSAYLYFATQVRQDVVKENPSMKTTEVTKVVAAKWRELPKEKRTPFDKLAVADQKRYEKEIKAYQARLAQLGPVPKDPDEVQAKLLKKFKSILAKSFKPGAFELVMQAYDEGKSLQIMTAAQTYQMQGGRGKKPDAMGFLTQMFGHAKAKELAK